MTVEKILVVEDEKKIARFLELELKYEGYEVIVSNEGRDGLQKALDKDIDLIILDLMLPQLSGIEVCRRIRKESDKPIIMLTAKDDISDKVTGLDSGADDYITKPFAIEELLARIRVALKRNNSKTTNQNDLKAGKLKLNKDKYIVMYEDEIINLSKTEFDLLYYLMKNKNIVLSRERIIENVWGYDFVGDTNITDVYIRYLRSKIDQKYGKKLISTVRGVGYILKDE